VDEKSTVIYYQRPFDSVVPMSLLSRKGLLAITAVVDIAVHAQARPVSAKMLAARNTLPPRHLEPVLQALVREGILRGIRGPRGGYELARDRRRITADEILRAAGTVEELEGPPMPHSELLSSVVVPALAQAERAFATALGEINVEDMARGAESLGGGQG
jgi:Rrf2 family iron-sulfur cluster assembly transcriptional regulator